jgi:hypothetical protein
LELFSFFLLSASFGCLAAVLAVSGRGAADQREKLN